MEKEKAIEYLNDVRNGIHIPAPGIELPLLNDKEKEAIDLAIAALEKQEKERWIPVTERLPEPGVNVLVTHPPNDWNGKKYKVSPAWRCNVEDEGPLGEWALTGRLDFSSVIPIDKAIAWRPLPEPYTEEES